MPSVRNERTHVSLRFIDISDNKTKVILTHKGWGEAYNYFIKAWGTIVLPRLKYRFENSPINWKNLKKNFK
jgi:hypothetical protein